MDKHRFEFLYQASPIFHAFKESIIIFENIQRYNSKGSLEEAILVVSLSGIFLLKNRSFRRSYTISKFIPLIDISSLNVTNDNFMVQSQFISMTFVHSNHVNIAAHIYHLFTLFFPLETNLKIDLKVSTEKKDQFNSFSLRYQSKCLLADRFLACILHWKFELTESFLKEAYDFLTKIHSNFIISPSIAESPYFEAILQACSFDSTITTLSLKRLTFNSICKTFLYFLNKNLNISRVFMKKVDFCSPINNVQTLFSELSTKIHVHEFIYKSCNFTSPDTCLYFESFNDFSSPITLLSFHRCQFTTKTLDSLFQSIFFSSCYHSLENLHVSGIQFSEELQFALTQLSGCIWVLEKHCLLNLSVPKCNLQFNTLLPQLFQFDSGITTLDLSGNYFITPFSSKTLKMIRSEKFSFKALQFLQNLNISRCHFIPETFLSLFEVISHSQSPIRIDCTSIILENIEQIFDKNDKIELQLDYINSWKEIFSKLKELTIPNLVGLIWDKNPLDIQLFPLFINFIKSLTKIEELSLSRCIIINGGMTIKNDFIHHFHDLISEKHFKAFEMNGDKFGSFIHPIITFLCNEKVECLSIEDQSLGDQFINCFLDNIPSSLKSLKFSGFYIPHKNQNDQRDSQKFINILRKVLNSKLSFCQWPGKDASLIIQQITNSSSNAILNSQQEYIIKQIKQLHASFISRYGNEFEIEFRFIKFNKS